MEDNAIFLYKKGLYKKVRNVIRFPGRQKKKKKKKKNTSKGMTYRTH